MSLHEQTAEIRPPSIPSPPEDLFQEPPIGLHRREQLDLLTTLHIRAPPMAHHPPRQKLIVPRIELILSQPVVMREAVEEIGVFEDDGPVRGGAPGETGDAAVDVGRGRDLDVADGEAERGEDLPHRHPAPDLLHALARADAADLLVLKTRQHIRQHRRRPDRIVVRKDDDVRRRVLDPVAHLQPFVRKGDGEHADALRVDLVGEVLQGAEHFFFGDDEDFFGLADEPAVGGFFELLAGVDGGDDDGDVFGGDVGWVFGEGDGAVCGCCGETD